MLECHIVSPLTKVFPDAESLHALILKKGSALRGEVYSFQIACRSSKSIGSPMRVEISDSPLKPFVRLRREINVVTTQLGDMSAKTPEELAAFELTRPGLCPDLLKDDAAEKLYADPGVWFAVWAEIRIPDDFAAGSYTLSFTLYESQDSCVSVEFDLEVIGAMLPPQTLTHTEWFHCDCLAHAYRTTPWTPKFWKILEKYFRNFTAHGINMLYTPIVTPALDTAVGKERMTAQLIGITRTKGKYSFDFTKLKRWIRLAQKCGVRYFEMAHLFSQWGAKATPKIIADVDGKKDQKIFGWHVDALSPEYKKFLDAMLPALVRFLKDEGAADDCYFHISDEPSGEQVEHYGKVSALVRKHLKGFRILDAASHKQYFTEGLITLPVPCEDMLHEFLELDVPERWTYYCGGPDLPYSNRLHEMPASANRIMGTLMYVYEVEGFLHWGYNFWNRGTTCEYADPLSVEPNTKCRAGDPCLVYPGPDGPMDSMRGEVFFAGLQDQRALQLLESLTDRKTVMKLISKTAGKELKINDFPLDPAFLHKLRDAVNTAVRKQVASKARRKKK